MDLKAFKPKAPVNIASVINTHKVNGEHVAGVIGNGNSARYFVGGFSLGDLRAIGIQNPSQLGVLKSMDDAGSIELVTFASDPNTLGFVLTENLARVIQNTETDLNKLSKVPWTIFEIIDATSETPTKGHLKPLLNQDGKKYRVSFKNLHKYFKHVTGSGKPDTKAFDEGVMNKNMESKKVDNGLDLNVAPQKTAEEISSERGQEYYDNILRQERERKAQEEKRRALQQAQAKADARRRRAEGTKPVSNQAHTNQTIVFKNFDDIINELVDEDEASFVMREYQKEVDLLRKYFDGVRIEISEVSRFDNIGRKDLIIAMNRERTRVISAAFNQLRKRANEVEELVDVKSEEANAGIREEHSRVYIQPLQAYREKASKDIETFEKEQEALLEDGFEEWYKNLKANPKAYYKKQYHASVVEEPVRKEQIRIQNEYDQLRDVSNAKFRDIVNTFVENRKAKDLKELVVDWEDMAYASNQNLADRLETVQASMENRRVMEQLASLKENILESQKASLNVAKNSEVSVMTNQSLEGTVQQNNPAPKITSQSQKPVVKIEPVEKAPKVAVSEQPAQATAPKEENKPAVMNIDGASVSGTVSAPEEETGKYMASSKVEDTTVDNNEEDTLIIKSQSKNTRKVLPYDKTPMSNASNISDDFDDDFDDFDDDDFDSAFDDGAGIDFSDFDDDDFDDEDDFGDFDDLDFDDEIESGAAKGRFGFNLKKFLPKR